MAWSRAWMLAGAAVLLGAAGLVWADDAEATHYWAATLSWEPVVEAGFAADSYGVEVRAYRIHGHLSFDADVYTFFNDCHTIRPGQLLDSGNYGSLTVGGAPVSYWLYVMYVDPNPAPGHCRFAAAIADASGQPGVAAAVQGPTKVVWGTDYCCRKETGFPHPNNPARDVHVTTTIVPGEGSSPVIDFPYLSRTTDHGPAGYGLHHCPVNVVCKWYVEASDPDNDTLSWRLGTAAEAGDPAFQHPGAPWGGPFSVNAATGLVTWDTRYLAVGGFYSTHIIVEDGITAVPVDFMIQTIPGCPDGTLGDTDPVTGEFACRPIDEPDPCQDPDDPACRPPVNPPPQGSRPYEHRFNAYLPSKQPTSLVPGVSEETNGLRGLHLDYDAMSTGDADGDGIPDEDDHCPGVLDTAPVDIDDDGRAAACDEDDDGDGILDELDACPTDPDPSCSVVPEGKEAESGADAARGTFRDAPASPAGPGAAALAIEESRTGTPWPLAILVMGLLLLVLATRRRR